jgi:hypothetical protein
VRSCVPFGVLLAFSIVVLPLRTVAQQNPDPLPPGRGRDVLQASCTTCHDLTEVTKFRGYYTRDDWRDIVRTMIEYGAKVKDEDVNVLVDYLAKNLGKPSEAPR